MYGRRVSQCLFLFCFYVFLHFWFLPCQDFNKWLCSLEASSSRELWGAPSVPRYSCHRLQVQESRRCRPRNRLRVQSLFSLKLQMCKAGTVQGYSTFLCVAPCMLPSVRSSSEPGNTYIYIYIYRVLEYIKICVLHFLQSCNMLETNRQQSDQLILVNVSSSSQATGGL